MIGAIRKRTDATNATHHLPSGYLELLYVDSYCSRAGFKVTFKITGDIPGFALKGKSIPESDTSTAIFCSVYSSQNYTEWSISKYQSTHATYPNKLMMIYRNTSRVNEYFDMKYNNNFDGLEEGSVINRSVKYFDGTTGTWSGTPYQSMVQDYIGIGGLYNNLNGTWYSQNRNTSRISYLALYKASTKKYEFIPCIRKSDGKVGMYDTVNKAFHSSETATEFTAGPRL